MIAVFGFEKPKRTALWPANHNSSMKTLVFHRADALQMRQSDVPQQTFHLCLMRCNPPQNKEQNLKPVGAPNFDKVKLENFGTLFP